jgi:tetratricopeptide (TPR) repeat protein
MSKIKDPKAFIENRRDVFSRADGWDKDYWRKEDQLYVERFGDPKWIDRNVQYDLAEAYYRLGDYQSASRKLDEMIEMEPNKYFGEKYLKYRSKLTESQTKNDIP